MLAKRFLLVQIPSTFDQLLQQEANIKTGLSVVQCSNFVQLSAQLQILTVLNISSDLQMQKKINIEVNNLMKKKNIQKSGQKQIDNTAPLNDVESRASLKSRIVLPEKGVTFQQLYFQMKKNKQNCFINSNGPIQKINLLKPSEKSLATPQNRSLIINDTNCSEKIHKSLDKVRTSKTKFDNQQHFQGRKTLKRVIRKKHNQKMPINKKQNLHHSNDNQTKNLPKEIGYERQILKQFNQVQCGDYVTNSSNTKNKLSLKVQYQDIFRKLDHTMHTHLRQIECFLQFNQFIHVLKMLGFTAFETKFGNSSNQEACLYQVNYSPIDPDFYKKCEFYSYIIKMWKQLGGQTYGGVVKDNLLKFLLIISGQYKEKQINDHKTNNNYQKPAKHSYINTNLKLTVNSMQIQDIFTFYFPLRMKRQSQLKNSSNHYSNDKDYQVFDAIHQTHDFIKLYNGQKEISPQKLGQLSILDQQQIIKVNEEKQSNYSQQQKLGAIQKLNQKMSQFSPKLVPQYRLSNMEQSHQFLTPGNSKQLYSSQIPTMIQTQSRQQIFQTRRPLLSVDVNLGQGKSQKLIVFQGQNAHQVSLRLKQKYHISEQLRDRFQRMLEQHIRSLLFKIQQVSQELFSDQQFQTEKRNLPKA